MEKTPDFTYYFDNQTMAQTVTHISTHQHNNCTVQHISIVGLYLYKKSIVGFAQKDQLTHIGMDWVNNSRVRSESNRRDG